MSRVTRVLTVKSHFPAPETAGEMCLVQIHGPELGKRFVVETQGVTIGYEPGNQVVVDMDTVSRRHARISVQDGQPFVEDLSSTNGTFVNDCAVTGPAALRSGDRLKVGRAVFKFLCGDDLEAQYYEAIYTLTIVDGLTGVHNKRYLMDFLEREMERSRRFESPLSVVLFDLDHFKRVNDTYGHIAGDYVLREMAELVRRYVRREQCFARYGGEEFALVLPETGLQDAAQLAEKVRALTAAHTFIFDGARIPVTASMGVAQVQRSQMSALELLKAADVKLYEAKHQGRNRVVS